MLISKSYWFDKPRFVKQGKTATSCNSAFAWGTTQLFSIHHQAVFWRRCRGLKKHSVPSTTLSTSFVAPLPGTLKLQQGESYTLNLFTLFLSCFLYFSFSLFSCFKILKPKKISIVFIFVLLVCLVIYLLSMVNFFETRSYWQGGFTEERREYYKEYRLSQKGIHYGK